MTRAEILDAALKKLAQVVKLLDSAERVNFRVQSSGHIGRSR